MIRRLRLMIVMARPPVFLILGSFAALGRAATDHGEDPRGLTPVLAAVACFLLFSVACNDLADEAIDRVNLPGDRRRPLISGAGDRREVLVIGVISGAIALAAAAALNWPALVTVAGGLALSAGYSLRPVRIAERGALASLLLPACYVAVPFLLGVFAVRDAPRRSDLVLLGGLYLGFVGRILLKDFRDVRGDALFGKRTFLVRHGRRWTCVFSAVCWTAATPLLIAAVPRPTPVLAAVLATHLGLALVLLRALSIEAGARRDEALVAAIAIVGRGIVLTLLVQLSAGTRAGLIISALTAVTAGQALAMVRRGPITRLRHAEYSRSHPTVEEEAIFKT